MMHVILSAAVLAAGLPLIRARILDSGNDGLGTGESASALYHVSPLSCSRDRNRNRLL